MSRDDRHSRLVSWLKVALPLAALAILSTLFLVAETLDPDAAIPYADVDVARILEDQGVTRPAFGGVTSEGVEVALVASAVRPEDNAFTGTDLNVTLKFDQASVIRVSSPSGAIDVPEQTAMLAGGVWVESTSGYDFQTDTIRTSWKTTTLETDSEVVALGPPGRIEAGRMSLSANPEATGHVLVFNDGVRLVYQPKP